MPEVFKNAGEGIKYLSDIMFNATEDQRGVITSLVSEIADLENKIKELQDTGGNTGEIVDLTTQKISKQDLLDKFLKGVSAEQTRANIVLTPIVDLDATQSEFDKGSSIGS